MASGLHRTKRRIQSVSSTQKITKAMEMVATVKLKRFRDSFEHASYYSSELEGIIARAAKQCKIAIPEAKENEGVDSTCYLLITSDLGLCGSYNSELYRYLNERFNADKDILYVLGEKGATHYIKPDSLLKASRAPEGMSLELNPKVIRKTAEELHEEFLEKKFSKVVVIYTHYVNSLRFEPSAFTLLPISLHFEEEPYESYAPPIFEPSPEEFLKEKMGQYLAGELYQKLGESELSEQASRRNAMENANDNAEELLDKLKLEYNKARQASITQEITEVVNGANSAS